MTSKGKVKKSLVPWTCRMSRRRAILIEPSFLRSSNQMVMQKVELASTFMMMFSFFFSSSNLGGGMGWEWMILSLTPSDSVIQELPSNLISKKKLILEQFLKGIFITFLLGIFIILKPVFSFTISFRQIMLGTSPRLLIGIVKGANSSTCRVKVPLISVETYSSGMVALILICIGSCCLMGTYICDTSSPPSTNLKVNTS